MSQLNFTSPDQQLTQWLKILPKKQTKNKENFIGHVKIVQKQSFSVLK